MLGCQTFELISIFFNLQPFCLSGYNYIRQGVIFQWKVDRSPGQSGEYYLRVGCDVKLRCRLGLQINGWTY